MTRHRFLTATLGLFIVLGLLSPSLAHAQGSWMDNRYDNRGGGYNGNQGFFSKLFNFGGGTAKTVGKIALQGAGTVVAGIFGSRFGPIGTIVGGAAGFLVSRWVSDKVFGGGGREQCYGPGWGQPSLFTRIKNKILGRPNAPPMPYPGGYNFPPMGSGIRPGDNADLGGLRQDFFEAYNNLKRALSTGTEAEKAAAKQAYDSAREAYFQAKNH
jgi:hypothetical protein